MSLIAIFKPDLVSQSRSMSDSEYLEKFRTQLDVMKSAGGDICSHNGVMEDELARAGVVPTAANAAEVAAASLLGRQRFEGALFLAKSNQVKCGRLCQELANDFNKGLDSYPESLSTAYELMLHDVRDQDTMPHPHGNSGVSFNMVDGPAAVPGSNTQANPRPDVTCRKCGETGHFFSHCAEARHANGTVLVVTEIAQAPDAISVLGGDTVAGSVAPSVAAPAVTMTLLGSDMADSVCSFQCLQDGAVDQGPTEHLISQHKAMTGHAVPDSWILLDNQSTVNMFCNKNLLQNIREGKTICRISCKAGTAETNLIGDLPGHPFPVWFHPKGIANVLSPHRVSQHCQVEHDSSETGACFHVRKQDGTALDFQPSVSGLHCYDSREHGITFAQIVAKMKEKYTVRACKRAVVARKLQDVVGRPSTRDHVKIVEGEMLRNCPITRADILAAEDIFGPNMGSLKGKTVRRKNIRVPSLVADVPYDIVKMHRNVTLCFGVNKIAFLVAVSRNLRFGTTKRLLSRNSDVVGKALVTVLKFYRQRGFRVKECHGDGQFESLRATLANAGSGLNVTGEDEHVPEVERHIRTVKERARSSCDTVPFKKLPGMMIVELIHGRVYWLNSFPAKDGVSAVQSPRRIMTGQHVDYGLHCQLDFGVCSSPRIA
jgi:hypothetical protein